MRKPGWPHLVVALGLLSVATIIFLPSGAGPGALDSEKAFDAEFHNSLYYLDRAKWRWAEEMHKSEQDVPTMKDLAPYLGDWTNRIGRLAALGIDYKLTPLFEMQPQSDVATLTRDLRFQRGFSRFYPAGTSLCLNTGWARPQSGSTSSFLAFYHDNRGLVSAVFFLLAIGNLLLFVLRSNRNLKNVSSPAHEHRNA
jgi:hypothetical protein